MIADRWRRSAVTASRARLLVFLLIGALLVASCAQLRYYSQAVGGGAGVLLRRQPISRLLASGELDQAKRERLELALALRRFAVEELELPENKSYLSYVELGRDYAVWNVFAAPRLSVDPKLWCFPIVGCVSYRGYFSEQSARRYAAKLARQEYDVAVGGVIAYSTLGFFADPVLDTFLFLPEAELAGLLFHELAHQRAFARGDTVFNESFATVVELEGVARWLEAAGRGEELASFLAARRREQELVGLVLEYRRRLEELYRLERPAAAKLERKAELLAELGSTLRQRTAQDGTDPYAGWLQQGINNAHLAQVSAYHELVPALEALLEEAAGDLGAFYQRIQALASLDREARWAVLGVAIPGDRAR